MPTPEALNGAQATVQHPEHPHVRDSRALRVFGERTSRVIREATTLSVLIMLQKVPFFFIPFNILDIASSVAISPRVPPIPVSTLTVCFDARQSKCVLRWTEQNARGNMFFESSLCGSVLKTPKNCSSITVL